MPIGSKDLDRALDEIIRQAFQMTPPPVLYHYTDWNGLKGILSSRRFWSSAHDCMNDPAELVSANDTIMKAADELQQANTSEVILRGIDTFVANYPAMQVSKYVPVFVTSFSAARDDAGQWRNYADGGRGVCVGIRVLQERPPVNRGLEVALLQVDYSEGSWHAHVLETFRKACAAALLADSSLDTMAQFAGALFRVAAFESLRAKQLLWAREQEFRLAALMRDPHDPLAARVDIRERQSRGKPVRYVEVLVREEAKLIALAEIIIGPNQDLNAAQRDLEQVLERAGYSRAHAESYPTITMSRVPVGTLK